MAKSAAERVMKIIQLDNHVSLVVNYAKVYWCALSKFKDVSFVEKYENLKYQISIGGLGPQNNVILDAPVKHIALHVELFINVGSKE